MDLEKLTLQINTRDVYEIIQETLNYFKSFHSKSTSQKQAHIKKLERILEVTELINFAENKSIHKKFSQSVIRQKDKRTSRKGSRF